VITQGNEAVPQKSRTTKRQSFERKVADRTDIMRRIAPVLVPRLTAELAEIRENIARLAAAGSATDARMLGELWLEEANLISRLERLGFLRRPVN
jgi:hypothetical protein